MATNPVTTQPQLETYQKFIVMFSGGKDSLACLLHLLELGVPTHKIELWHQDVDGREGSRLMDWPCTRDYCRKVARAFNVPIYFSWKVGGFEREMNRTQARTAPIKFETPDGTVHQVGGTGGKESTRRKFPAQSASLTTRWCSAYLKIDVGIAAIRNQPRFNQQKTLVITGERAQESAARAKYKTFEIHKSDNRSGKSGRWMDHWRPVLDWAEYKVWEIIKRHHVNPHPAYWLGWGRVSCAACIFGNKDQWASLGQVQPDTLLKIAQYEQDFNHTINQKKPVLDLAAEGTPYEATHLPGVVRSALREEYTDPIILLNGAWDYPPGAFKECGGPV